MIHLYAWPTPNAHKISIMLEETGLEYRTVPVDITKGEQFSPEFLAISPNNKMPAIVDDDGPDGQRYHLFESGAILIYLADTAGALLPTASDERYRVIEWLMFQMANVGPMLGQCHHFRHYAPEHIDYAVQRYTNEASRLYGVLDKRLAESAYLGGDTYSIADIATYPWIRAYERQGQRIEDYPRLQRWLEELGERDAVQRGLELLADRRQQGGFDKQAWETLFGGKQYERR